CSENAAASLAVSIRCSVCSAKKPGRICWIAIAEVIRPTRVTVTSARTRRTFSRLASAGRPRGSKLDQSGVDRDDEVGGSVLGEGIPDAPHRADVARLRRIGLHLVADVADVDVDGALVLLEGVV